MGNAQLTIEPAESTDPFSPTILIVDDHPAVRAGLKNLISGRAGWSICGEAADGEEAVALAIQLRPSVIVMDISMPRLDGLEATRRIRERLPTVEVVIVSQHDSEQVVFEAQRAGARGFVMKSHLSADLLPALEAALLHNARISAPISKAWQNAIFTPKQAVKESLADPGPHDDLDLMSGGGEMGALMRAHDWAKTSFGPVSKWPQSLRTALRICLDSRFPIVIWWGPELRLLYNDAWRPTLGTTKHPHALGAPGVEVWADVWDTIGPMLEGVMRTGQATWENDQLLLFDRHGYVEESYWTYSYSAIRLSSGEVGGVFSAVHEVTDRVLSARRLKTLREVADQVVQARNDVDACTLAMQSIVRNPADCPYAMIFLREGAMANCVAASFPAGSRVPDKVDLSRDDPWAIQKTIESRSAQVFSVDHPETLPGAPFGDKCTQAVSVPILGTTRDPIAVLTIGISPYRALDQSYREFFESLARNLAANINNARAYDEERKRAESLAELDRAKTTFFSNVSHEFRTPLTLMLGPLEDTLAAGNGLPAEQRERLEVAHRNSMRLLKLVNTLLDFSRIEAGRIQASYEPVDLALLTAELASVFRSAAERAGLRLIITCPQLAEPAYVDREMWEKIVFNLLSNAFKFTFTGEIEVSLKPADALVELAVRDTGTGIPEQELPHLFERFYRVKGAQGRTFEGSGIGLALVQELAKLHGGTVRVQSQVNRGTTFTVSLPLGKEHLPADRIGAARTMESTGLRGDAYVQEALRWLPGGDVIPEDIQAAAILSSGDSSPQQNPGSEKTSLILLADDNADMREYLQRLLRGQYEVVAAADGEAALKSARERRPDLILSDVMMPRLDGFGLMKAVRSDESLKSVPIILLSARAGEEARVEGIESGADDFLVKPFSVRELLARVRTHLAMSRIRQEAAALEGKLRAEAELDRERLRQMIDALPTAIYTTDAEGRLTHFNPAAVQFSGREPKLGTDQWCVSWKLFRSDGTPLPHEECPMAIALKEGRIVEGGECIAERPDGKRIWFTPYPRPLRNAENKIIGGINMLVDITERKQAEQATNLLAAIVESSDDAIVSKNLDGIITSWNKSAERIFGYTAEEAVGRHITLIIPEDRRDEETGIITRLRRGDRVDHFHTVRLRKDGRTLDVSLTISPLRNSAGKVIGASKVARDITAERRAERALRESEERFRAIVETTPECVKLVSPDGTLLHLNSSGLQMVGAQRAEEVVGKSIYDIIAPEHREKFRAFNERICGGEKGTLEFDIVGLTGVRRNMETHAAPLGNPSGGVVQLGVTRDVSERKHAEERERKITAEAVAATAKFRAVFEQTTVFAGIMTKEGIMIDANKLCLEACGYKPDEVLGRPFWDTAWWRNHKEEQHKIKAATTLAAQGVPFRETLRYSWADGTERLVDFALYPILDDDGHVLFLHPTGVDITDIKRTEENYRKLAETLDAEVRARTKQLEERNADVLRQSQQLRDLSWRLLRIQDEERRHIARELHDSAGQTLTVLGIGLARLVQKTGRNAPELASDTELIQEAVQQLHREIRTTSYLLHPPLLDESGLHSALSWYVQGLIERSGLNITLNIAEDFGRLPAEMELVVFRLVQESLTNIHRHSGSKTASIRISRKTDLITLEVEDQGKGMSPEKLAEIQSRGSGVGIRGMQERVRQFEGAMKVESGSSGTRIVVTIPMKQHTLQGQSGAEPVQPAVH